LAKQLGLESVEELEAAIDEMDGIAPDGGPLEGDNLAREARVRSAYLDWCKEYGKESDETRFQQFSSNYLEMEEFAKESGKEMALNEYADCTEEEYAAMMDGSADAAKEAESAVKEAEAAIKAAEGELSGKPEAAAPKVDEAAIKKAEEQEAKKKAAEAVAAKKQAVIDAKKKAEQDKKTAIEEEKEKANAEKGTFRETTSVFQNVTELNSQHSPHNLQFVLLT
jgi:hypothetical protein